LCSTATVEERLKNYLNIFLPQIVGVIGHVVVVVVVLRKDAET